VVLILFSTLNGHSQILFSKGYFVTNKGERTICLIKNVDWLDSPKSIQYKMNDSAAVKHMAVDSIKEFGIDDFSRYVKATVKIDRSPVNINLLNDRKQPEWSEETLMLKEVVCGKAGLWVYPGTERDWYFYSIDNSLPEQLIYKEYLDEGKLCKNAAFRQQLYVSVQNEETSKVNFLKLGYDQKSLTEYFNLYNSKFNYCVSADFKKPVREVFNVKVAGYINYSSLSVTNTQLDSSPFKFDDKFNWMGGIELEWFLSFNRNTLSLILNPVYEHMYYNKTTVGFKLGNIVVNTKFRYFDVQSVDFPIGLRYTKYLRKDSKCYFDFSYSPSVWLLKGTFSYMDGYAWDVKAGSNIVIGAGYGFKNWGVGLKYHSSRNLLVNYGFWSTEYSKISLSLTYKLFKIKGK
jgi:hypothetical protein